jgi:hypothetical protein
MGLVTHGRSLALTLALGIGSCVAPTAVGEAEGHPSGEATTASEPDASSSSSSGGDAGSGTGDPVRGHVDGPDPLPDLGPPGPPIEPRAGFTDVTAEAGLLLDPGPIDIPPWCLLDDAGTPRQIGDFCLPQRYLGAAAAADYDDDGWPDLYLSTLEGPDRLLRNRGDGSFEDVTADAGLTAIHASGGVAWLDVEGDGDLDLLLTAVGSTRNFLYVNDGQGGFEEDAVARGVAVDTGTPHAGMGVAVGDYDLDGWLDLFVTDWHPDDKMGNDASHARLLHGLGPAAPGSFEDVTEAMGIDLREVAPLVDAKPGEYGFAPAFVDLDGDGWPELALAADFSTSRLWWNEGGGAFVDGTIAAGVATERNAMGSTFGDIDGDGDLDWFVSAISTPRYPTLGNRLYRNDGMRQFTDVTDAYGVRDGGWGWGAALFDVEHDGDLDLALAAGWWTSEFHDESLSLWIDEGVLPWSERARELGVGAIAQGRGLLPFDYDRDGDLDLLVASNAEPPTLLRNDMATGHWLVVRVWGGGGNPRSLGARVRVRTEPAGPWQVREIGVGSHLFGQAEAVAHFGLGDDDGQSVEVEITWPASSQQVVLHGVEPDQWLEVER